MEFFFFNMYFTYLKNRGIQGKGKTERRHRNSPSSGSLSKWSHWPGRDQATVGSRTPPGSPASSPAYPVSLVGSWISHGAAGMWSGTATWNDSVASHSLTPCTTMTKPELNFRTVLCIAVWARCSYIEAALVLPGKSFTVELRNGH